MATVISPVADVCRSAKRAAAALAQIDTVVKDRALESIAAALEARLEEILAANARDMQAGVEADIGDALLDRLRLDDARVAGIARAVREIAALADPVGEVISGERLPNGLDVRKVRVLYAASGNCHVYVDASADLDQAEAIVINAKTQRPGVCNAAETLLVHAACAAELIPRLVRSLGAAGVLLRGDDRTLALAAAEPAQASDDGADRSDPAR